MIQNNNGWTDNSSKTLQCTFQMFYSSKLVDFLSFSISFEQCAFIVESSIVEIAYLLYDTENRQIPEGPVMVSSTN